MRWNYFCITPWYGPLLFPSLSVPFRQLVNESIQTLEVEPPASQSPSHCLLWLMQKLWYFLLNNTFLIFCITHGLLCNCKIAIFLLLNPQRSWMIASRDQNGLESVVTLCHNWKPVWFIICPKEREGDLVSVHKLKIFLIIGAWDKDINCPTEGLREKFFKISHCCCCYFCMRYLFSMELFHHLLVGV